MTYVHKSFQKSNQQNFLDKLDYRTLRYLLEAEYK